MHEKQIYDLFQMTKRLLKENGEKTTSTGATRTKARMRNWTHGHINSLLYCIHIHYANTLDLNLLNL